MHANNLHLYSQVQARLEGGLHKPLPSLISSIEVRQTDFIVTFSVTRFGSQTTA